MAQDWALDELAPPEQEPVSLQAAKEHLRVDHDAEDALIARLIVAARRWCEHYQGRCLAPRTLRLRLAGFPKGAIRLPYPPLASVTSVTYLRADGVEVTVPPTAYAVVSGEPSQVVPVSAWPSEPLAPGLPVSVTYEAGTGATEDEQAAILLLLGHLHANREAEVVGSVPRALEFGVKALLHPRRVVYEGPGD